MRNKIYLGLASAATVAGTLLSVLSAKAAALTTTTLASSIDTVNSTFYDYFVVLLTNYWPFIVGAGILLIVWHFGRRLLTMFN